jgi:hypothetical protein
MPPDDRRAAAPALGNRDGELEHHGAGDGSEENGSATDGLPVGIPVQLALGETAMARRGDAITSIEAAKKVRYTAGCRTVYKALLSMGRDATAEDISEHVGLDVMLPNTVSRRLTDLERLALVVRLEPVQGKRGRSVHAWRPRHG